MTEFSSSSVGRSPCADRLVSAVGPPLLLFLFLPLTVFVLNLNAVAVPKRVVLESGLIVTVLLAVGLAALIVIPRVGALVAVGARLLAFAFFILILFPNRSGEIAGFDDHLAEPGNFTPMLKLTILLGAGAVWHHLRPGQFRALVQSLVMAAAIGSAGIAIFAQSKTDEAAELDSEAVSRLLALGTEKNVFVLAFDGFTGYRMAEILEQRPELRESFGGFTLYPRAIASALNTPAGSSAILTGDLRLAIETDDWGKRNAQSLESSFLADAARAGHGAAYLSSLTVPSSSLPAANEQAFYSRGELPFPARAIQYAAFQTVAFARIFPEFLLKAFDRVVRVFTERFSSVAVGARELLVAGASPSERLSLASNQAFGRIVKSLNIGEDKSKVVFVLSKLSHSPWNFTEDGRFVRGAGWESSSIFVVRSIMSFLERLRALHTFDSSLIILTSDHGSMPVQDVSMGGTFDESSPLAVEFNPLIMVKLPYARRPLRVSEMTVWLGDVAATVRDSLSLPHREGSPFQTRSLLRPEDAGRILDLPLFFRPDQESYHGPLQRWTRVDVKGRFVDFGPLSSNDPNRLLSKRSILSLRAGEDKYRTELVQEGWWRGIGTQFGAWIEVDKRPVATIENTGVVVLDDADGPFSVRLFKAPQDGFVYLASLPESANVFAAAVRVPAGQVSRAFPESASRMPLGELTNCLWLSSAASQPRSYFQCSQIDISVEAQWR